MKKYKIPVRVEAITYVDVTAKNLNDACMKAMDYRIVSEIAKNIAKNIEITDGIIPEVDDEKLKQSYPKEFAQMESDEQPYWEKMGWRRNGPDTYLKGNAIIENRFDDVGWGFQGTVWIGEIGKSGFHSLEAAIDYAEGQLK